MRVLMLSQFYPPVTGGQERHVRDLAQALATRGHEVEVATIATGGDDGTTLDGEVAVHRLRTTAQRMPSIEPRFPRMIRMTAPRTRPRLKQTLDPVARRRVGNSSGK